MQESLDTIQYVFRVMAASQVLLLSGYMVIYQRTHLGWLTALASFGFFSYLVVPFSRDVWGFDGLHLFFVFLSSSIPALLWLLARRFFTDETHVPIWFWLVWLLYLVLWLPNWQTSSATIDPGLSNFAFNLVPQLIKQKGLPIYYAVH